MSPTHARALTQLPLAIVQARMTSSRLPGKVMLDLHGEPMILRQLERISRARNLSGVVVATSTDASDDHLAQYLVEHGHRVARGPLDDVLGRYVQVIEDYGPDTIVRLTADCPMISPTVIDHVVQAFMAAGVDYCSNTLVPTYPDGLDVEVVRAAVLRDVDETTEDLAEREHVTLGVYRHPERFTLLNYVDPSGRDRSNLRWTVDNSDDFSFVNWIYEYLYDANDEFDYQDVTELLERFPEKSRTSRDAVRNAALQGLDTGAMVFGDQS